ncbi:MAG TPA: hypothetical protein VEH08_06885 [Methanomassiliicoccales archaeon]|nr:hypothetical protein [Methanomassiliicoccales archaeon]
MKPSRPTPGRPLKRHGNARSELRSWMDREGYERLLREAAARDLSASKCVRECLREYFALKDTMALPPSAEPDRKSKSSFTVRPASLFEAIEGAIAGALQESDRRTNAVLEKIRLLACMLDRSYEGIVVQMAEADPATREARIAKATESTKRWRRAVVALYRDGGPEPVDVECKT